jgi:serine/threonine-protein kinase RsbW
MELRRLRSGDNTRGAQVAEFVEALARQAGLTTSRAYWLRLATDELTMNIVQHGYRGRSGTVDLVGNVEADRVWVRIEDDAPPFDPSSYEPCRRLAAPPETRQEGGYGLLLALGKLDEFRYDYDGGRNRNTLVMRRSAGEVETQTSKGGRHDEEGTDHC